MNIKEKTALISGGLNVVLTAVKFFFFFITGSLAILADAWHSFTDIITSILVYFSIIQSNKAQPPQGDCALEKTENSVIKKYICGLSPEHKASFVIGIFVIGVALSLLYRVVTGEAELIKNPVLVGILFIVFSVASYFIYKFEIIIGKREKSVGLVADAMNSKSDMISSLIAGIALVLYGAGLRFVDRPAAFIIVLFIFSFGVETIINVFASNSKKDKENLFKFSTAKIIAIVFSFKWLGILSRFLDKKYNLNFIGSKRHFKFVKWAKYIVFAAVIAVIAYSSVYTVAPHEKAIVERFGRPVSREAVMPGIHLKFPYPIDNAVIYPAQVIKIKEIGSRLTDDADALIWSIEHGEGEMFISGDNNFFYPYLILHYKVSDLYNYHYMHSNPDILIEEIAYGICSKIFITKKFYDLATDLRKQTVDKITELIQDELDRHNAGIDVISVNLYDLHPPIFIAYAFEAVVAAMQEKEENINKAQGYRNMMLPIARGNALRAVMDAQNYKLEKTLRPLGEAERFILQANAFKINPSITKKRMYIDFLRDNLHSTRKIIIDKHITNPEFWIGRGSGGLPLMLQGN